MMIAPAFAETRFWTVLPIFRRAAEDLLDHLEHVARP